MLRQRDNPPEGHTGPGRTRGRSERRKDRGRAHRERSERGELLQDFTFSAVLHACMLTKLIFLKQSARLIVKYKLPDLQHNWAVVTASIGSGRLGSVVQAVTFPTSVN